MTSKTLNKAMASLGQTMWLLVVDCNNVSQSDEEKEERKELQILAKYRQRTYADSCAFTEGLLFILRMNSRVHD